MLLERSPLVSGAELAADWAMPCQMSMATSTATDVQQASELQSSSSMPSLYPQAQSQALPQPSANFMPFPALAPFAFQYPWNMLTDSRHMMGQSLMPFWMPDTLAQLSSTSAMYQGQPVFPPCEANPSMSMLGAPSLNLPQSTSEQPGTWSLCTQSRHSPPKPVRVSRLSGPSRRSEVLARQCRKNDKAQALGLANGVGLARSSQHTRAVKRACPLPAKAVKLPQDTLQVIVLTFTLHCTAQF